MDIIDRKLQNFEIWARRVGLLSDRVWHSTRTGPKKPGRILVEPESTRGDPWSWRIGKLELHVFSWRGGHVMIVRGGKTSSIGSVARPTYMQKRASKGADACIASRCAAGRRSLRDLRDGVESDADENGAAGLAAELLSVVALLMSLKSAFSLRISPVAPSITPENRNAINIELDSCS